MAALGAAVPKAPIHKNSKALDWKEEIRATRHVLYMELPA
jgi:hypothetical protein